MSTRADLTYNLPASVYTQPGSGSLSGAPLTFSLGSQTLAGSAGSTFSTQTVRAGPGTLPTSVEYAGFGNTAPARLAGTLVVLPNDTTPPSVPVVTVTPSLSAVNSFSFGWTAADNAGGTGIARYRYRVDGGAESVSTTAATSYGVGGSLAPGPGRHTFEVRAEDAAGNVSGWGGASFELRRGQARWSTGVNLKPSCAAGVPTGTVDVTGVLLDQDGKPLANRTVAIRGGGLPGSAQTAANGSAVFAGRTGTAFTLDFAGDASYEGVSTAVPAPPQPPCAVTPPPPQPLPPPAQLPAQPPVRPLVPPPAAPVQAPFSVDIPIG